MNTAAWTGRVGLALILLGIGWYGVWFRWASARKWRPLDVPVSLSPGHIRSPEFEINTQSLYRIDFDAPGGFGHEPGPSEPPGYQYCLPDLGTSWSLSSRGRVVARDTGKLCDCLGDFEAGPGRYVLDVFLSRDGSRFNALNPRLLIFEIGGAEEVADIEGFWAPWGLIVLATLGTGAILCSAMLRQHDKLDSFLKAWPLTLPGVQVPLGRTGVRLKAIRAERAAIRAEYYMGDPSTFARRPLTGLSSIALLTFLIFFVLFMLMWSCYWFPLTPVGFKVRLLRPAVTGQRSPGIQPVIVQVRFDKRSVSDVGWPRPSLYMNWRFVSRDDFEKDLQKELNLRPPDWPVYLEGDSVMEWRAAAEVIDIVQKHHAQVVLLTSLGTPPGPAGTNSGQGR